jgi:hypothetical protein
MDSKLATQEEKPSRTLSIFLGVVAFILGLFGWCEAIDPPWTSRIGMQPWETRFLAAAVFGSMSAVALALGVRIIRSATIRWLGWIVLCINVPLILLAMARLIWRI